MPEEFQFEHRSEPGFTYHAKITDDGKFYRVTWDSCINAVDYTVRDVRYLLHEEVWKIKNDTI